MMIIMSVLYKYALVEFYSKLTETTGGRQRTTPVQPVFVLTPLCCMLSKETANTNFSTLFCQGTWPTSSAFEMGTLHITPQRQFN